LEQRIVFKDDKREKSEKKRRKYLRNKAREELNILRTDIANSGTVINSLYDYLRLADLRLEDIGTTEKEIEHLRTICGNRSSEAIKRLHEERMRVIEEKRVSGVYKRSRFHSKKEG